MQKHSNVMVFSTVVLAILVLLLSACSGNTTEKKGGAEDVAQPSNPGPAGDAVNLKGDATKGAEVFASNCVACHGEQGKGGVENAGSEDDTIPPLNPIDSTLVNKDYKTYATNLDLFLEHGSTPPANEGATPIQNMPAFGDQKILTSQQIADVIAYVISLNK